MNKTLKFLIVPILLIVLFFVFLFTNNSNKKLTFESYENATSYIEKGWIPNNIPSDAKNISISYDLDNSISNGEFELSTPQDANVFVNSLKEENISDINLKFININFKNKFKELATTLTSKIHVYLDFAFVSNNNKVYFYSKK